MIHTILLTKHFLISVFYSFHFSLSGRIFFGGKELKIKNTFFKNIQKILIRQINEQTSIFFNDVTKVNSISTTGLCIEKIFVN